MDANDYRNKINAKKQMQRDAQYFVDKWTARGDLVRAARNRQIIASCEMIISECEKVLAEGAPFPTQDQFNERIYALKGEN